MSGWNASSRPTWDPQGGAGENTQGYPAPDSSEGTGDGWREPGASLPGSGYGERRRPDDLRVGHRPPRHRSGPPQDARPAGPPQDARPVGPPQDARPAAPPQDARPAGPPPDIFRQDSGYPDVAQRDNGPRGYGRPDRGQRDRAEYGYGGEADDREPHGREPHGREAYGREGYGTAQR